MDIPTNGAGELFKRGGGGITGGAPSYIRAVMEGKKYNFDSYKGDDYVKEFFGDVNLQTYAEDRQGAFKSYVKTLMSIGEFAKMLHIIYLTVVEKSEKAIMPTLDESKELLTVKYPDSSSPVIAHWAAGRGLKFRGFCPYDPITRILETIDVAKQASADLSFMDDERLDFRVDFPVYESVSMGDPDVLNNRDYKNYIKKVLASDLSMTDDLMRVEVDMNKKALAVIDALLPEE